MPLGNRLAGGAIKSLKEKKDKEAYNFGVIYYGRSLPPWSADTSLDRIISFQERLGCIIRKEL